MHPVEPHDHHLVRSRLNLSFHHCVLTTTIFAERHVHQPVRIESGGFVTIFGREYVVKALHIVPTISSTSTPALFSRPLHGNGHGGVLRVYHSRLSGLAAVVRGASLDSLTAEHIRVARSAGACYSVTFLWSEWSEWFSLEHGNVDYIMETMDDVRPT